MSSPTLTRPDADQVPAAARPATSPPPRPETWVLKVVMALTGSVFVAFVLFHMAGNLKVYLHPGDLAEKAAGFDEYAEWLRHLFNPLVPGQQFLWIFRAALLVCFILHVASALTIWVRARQARGRFGRKLTGAKHHLTGRSMIWTGLIIVCFLVFHLLDLTTGTKPVASGQFATGSAYNNLIASFERPAVAFFYGLTMVLLAIHLSHGLWSIVNDLGATGHRLRTIGLILADVVAIVVVLGNLSIPIAVQVGYLVAA